MLSKGLKFIKCPICVEGDMQFSPGDTSNEFNNAFDLEYVDKLEDGIIEQYLVFKCLSCGTTQKFNFKDIERMIRKEISKRVLTLRAKKELDKTINIKVKHLIYCGMCNGYDSNGSCPNFIYKDCQIRRMPNGL